MINHYLTVKDVGEVSIVIRKSEFISNVKPVTSEEEAIQFITDMKKLHRNANHHCSAYMIGEKDEIQRANDDGEPSGTAGKPILEVLKKMQLKNTAVVVTRYFGGIMLGTGGLIRAYGRAAKEGIIAAGIIDRVLYQKVQIDVDYSWYGKIENELNNKNYSIIDSSFADMVTLTAIAIYGEAQRLEKLITNLTNGQALIIYKEALYVDKEVHQEGGNQESSDS